MRDYKAEYEGRVAFIRELVKSAGASGIVYGNSGGKDSALVGILCKAACDNTVGIIMPCASKRNYGQDTDDGIAVAERFGIETRTVDLTAVREREMEELQKVCALNSAAIKNIAPRLRMTTLYAIAQSVDCGIVINTSNLSEDWVGYCTIYGDSAGAFSPLGMYTTEEVIALGAELGLPERFLIKPPSDGLTGKTDEDNLGFTYHAVNEYIRKGEVDPAIKEQIDRKHKVSRFKFQTLPVYQNGLPIVLPEETDYYNPNKK